MRAAQNGARFLAWTKAEEGLSHRTDVVTTFDLIDLREGRLSAPKKTPLGNWHKCRRCPTEAIAVANRGGLLRM